MDEIKQKYKYVYKSNLTFAIDHIGLPGSSIFLLLFLCNVA